MSPLVRVARPTSVGRGFCTRSTDGASEAKSVSSRVAVSISAGTKKVVGARDVRVDLRRSDPGVLRPHVRRPGVQDSEWLDGAEPVDRRSSPGEQVRVGADAVDARGY